MKTLNSLISFGLIAAASATVSLVSASAMADSVGTIACNRGYSASPSSSCGGYISQPEVAPYPETQEEAQQQYQAPRRAQRRHAVRQYRPVTKYKATRHRR